MSDKSLQLCRFCQRTVKLAYYCEECGASCCSDCLHEEKIDYFVCQDCNSKNIEIREEDGIKVCKDCGKENIIKITQLLKSCPKCGQKKILNLYEKKEELEQKFLELIKQTRFFIKPLRDVINELFLIRHKIKVARGPPIKCYHYPKMESELLALFKSVAFLKDNLLNRINTHFRLLALNKEYFFDIYNQPNSNIRIIESILDNLCNSHNDINKYIKSITDEIYEKFERYRDNLRFIEKINKLFLPYKTFLKLAENEKPVYAIKTTLSNGLDNQNRLRKSKGILFITNYDLSFVHEYGIFKKKQELIFKAPVDDLINIKDRGKLFKKLYVQFDYGKYEFSFPSNVIPKIIDYILLARAFQDNSLYDNESAKKLHEMGIDLSDLIKYIEEGINSFFSLKCKYNQNINIEQNKDFQKDIYYDRPDVPNYNSQSNQSGYIGSQNECKYYNAASQPPYNPIFFGDINHIPPMKDPRISNPEEYNYYKYASRQHIPPNFDRNMFYSQNVFHPYRYQNYKPQEGSIPNFYPPYERPEFYGNRPDFDEKNILMKRLERVQKFSPQFQPHLNNIRTKNFDDLPTYRNYDTRFNNNIYGKDYQKNHLSELFHLNNPYVDNSYNLEKDLFDYDENINKEMIELKKEKYSLIETLKKLDDKFDEGIISEVDYFKTFKNLQKEIYLIDQKIESLNKKYNGKQFLKRNLDKKPHFS